MGKPKAPKPPDPKTTASAQTSSNVNTAIASGELNNYNQVTPYGNLTYDQTGNYSWTDEYTGQTYTVPKYTVTQTLSPDQQQILDLNSAADINLATLGRDQSGRLQELLGTPVSLGNEEVESRLFDLGRQRLDPMFAQRQDALRTDLVNRGIGMGSEAYNREMERFSQQQNDAYNQLLLSGRGQALQEQLTERNQPINEITALLSGSQVSQPNFVSGGNNQIANTDVAGIINSAFQNEMDVYKQKSQQSQALMGGLFDMAGSLGGAAMMSDKRMKKNVEKVGTVKGYPLYEFEYKGQDKKHIGLMAQDVEKKKPEAVKERGGVKYVDYGKALK